MRRILVDYSRRRRPQKRGGGRSEFTLEPGVVAADGEANVVLAIDQALERLATFNERLGRLVECRYSGGMSQEEPPRRWASRCAPWSATGCARAPGCNTSCDERARALGSHRARLDALFAEALELPTDDSSEFAASACAAEPALRAELESLLRLAAAPLPALEPGALRFGIVNHLTWHQSSALAAMPALML